MIQNHDLRESVSKLVIEKAKLQDQLHEKDTELSAQLSKYRQKQAELTELRNNIRETRDKLNNCNRLKNALSRDNDKLRKEVRDLVNSYVKLLGGRIGLLNWILLWLTTFRRNRVK